MKKQITLGIMLLCALSIFAKDIYVSVSRGNNKNDGTSWNTPVKTISQAIKGSENGDKIHLESGIYSITQPIRLKDDMSIYGGYKVVKKGNSFEATRNVKKDSKAWDFEAETIISGETYVGKGTNTESKNTRLLECVSTNPTSIIVDGITFTKGNGKSTVGDENGGAIYSRTPGLVVRNCTFKENGVQKIDFNSGGQGGALYSDESATIENCYFYGNFANGGSSGGGAVFLRAKSGEIMINNCVFENNKSDISAAGLRTSGTNKIRIESCVFFNNVSKNPETFRPGAAVYLAGTFNPVLPSIAELNNCLIYNNSGSSAVFLSGGNVNNTTIVNNKGGVQINYGNTVIKNSVTWGNLSTSNNTTIGINYKSDINPVEISNCASDKKIANASLLQLKSNNNDANGPQFVNPSTFIGAAESDNDNLKDVSFLLKETSILKKNAIGFKL